MRTPRLDVLGRELPPTWKDLHPGWAGLYVLAAGVALVIAIWIFAVGAREVLPDSWSDSESCYENSAQRKCYYEESGR